MSDVKISVRQFQILVFFFTIGTTILIIPAGLAKDAKQDAWIAALLGVVLGLVYVLVYIKLGSLMKGMNFVQFSRYALGNVLGTIVSGAFIFFAFIAAATILNYVGDFLTTQILVQTPIQFVHMILAVTVLMAVRLGVETISRTAEIFFPWFVLLYIGMFVLLMPDAHLENIQPVFEVGMKSLLRAAIPLTATASLTLIAFFMIYPSTLNHPERSGGPFISSVAFGGIFIVVFSLISVAVLGADVTARLVYPGYALAKKVSIGQFIERVETIFAAIWIMAIFFKLVMYFYACVTGIAALTGMRDYRPIVLPLGLLIVVYGHVVYPNEAFRQEWDTKAWIPFIYVMGLVVPLVLLTVGWVKLRLKQRKQEASGSRP